MKKILTLACCFSAFALSAQINTPNTAARPFGSNTDYPHLTRLPSNLPTSGTYGSSQDAADAYNTWKTNYVEACTGTSNPQEYRIKFDNSSETVSEGIAYGMLLSAYAGDKALFDGLWAYYQTHSNANGVMNWKIQNCATAIGTGGATDAELDAALALIVASVQWADTSVHPYGSDARRLIAAVRAYEVQRSSDNGAYQFNNGDQWGFSNDCRNPSYQSPAYAKLFGEFIPSQAVYWDSVVTASYALLAANAHATTGLVSNWSDHTGAANSCNGANEYGWDACRHPWRMAKDAAWYGDSRAIAACNKISVFTRGVGSTNLRAPIALAGGTGSYHSPTFVSTWFCSALAAPNAPQSFVDSMYTETLAVTDQPPLYFGNTLRLLSLFMATGNFWYPLDATISLRELDMRSAQRAMQIHIFPNPLQSGQTLHIREAAAGDYQVCDLMGRELLRWQQKEEGATFAQSIDLPAGCYLLRLQNSKGRQQATIVVR